MTTTRRGRSLLVAAWWITRRSSSSGCAGLIWRCGSPKQVINYSARPHLTRAGYCADSAAARPPTRGRAPDLGQRGAVGEGEPGACPAAADLPALHDALRPPPGPAQGHWLR